MRIYKRVLISSTCLTAIPTAITTNRMSAAADLCRALVNCFGMPQVNPETIFTICKGALPDDIGNGFAVLSAESLAAVGILGTLFTGGVVPAFVFAGAINVPLVMPANARLLLMIASDLILIFARAFRDASTKCVKQPLEGDLERAVGAYRIYCKEVHRRVSKLIRRRDVTKVFKLGVIEEGFTRIIDEFKREVMEDVQAPTSSPEYKNPAGLYERPSSDLDTCGVGRDIYTDVAVIKGTLRYLEVETTFEGPDQLTI